ncbi:hypothetical protein D3C81_1986370 [compost metagenome]
MLATWGLTGDDFPELDDRRVGGHLLNFPFDAALRLVLNHDPRTLHNVPVQFGLAGAVAAHGVEVHSRFDHLRR